MKQICLNQDAVKWEVLRLRALNAHTGSFENTTKIPDGKYLRLHIADKYDAFDTNSENAVSDATSEYAMRHGKKKAYILFAGSRAIGWASFHRKEREYNVTVQVTTEQTVTVLAKSEKDALGKAEAEVMSDYNGMDNAPYVEAIDAELA